MKRFVWSHESDKTLSALYPNHTAAACAAVIGCTTEAARRRAHKLGLSKSASFYAGPASGLITSDNDIGASTRFQRGLTPWNKGKHFSAGGRSPETRFKPGRKPEDAVNYRPIGSLRINRDGVLERKVTDDPSIVSSRRWLAVHRLVWIEANGPVPEHHAIAFKAGARTTDVELITLDRLELVPRVELMRRNSIQTIYPPELRNLALLRGALNRKINRRSRESSP